MSEIRPIQLETGFLYVEMHEVDLPSETNIEDSSLDANLIGHRDRLDDGAATLRSTIDALAADVASALNKAAPTEWTLEFRIGFKGKNIPIPVLLSGEENAALKLTATWKRR
jgi:hypothetical protein